MSNYIKFVSGIIYLNERNISSIQAAGIAGINMRLSAEVVLASRFAEVLKER